MQTCLIIDESSVIRKVAGRIIFQLGLTVEYAAAPDEAGAYLDANGVPNIVIVSAPAGEARASEFVRELRAMPGGNNAVILGSMVEANLGQMTRLKRAGANGFVFKPFNREVMVGWLRPYLSEPAAA